MRKIAILGKWLCKKSALVLAVCAGAIILTVYLMQHLAGIEACDICIIQRYPYFAVLGMCLITIIVNKKFYAYIVFISGIALLITTGYGFYHLGVEEQWFESSCQKDIEIANSIENLKTQIDSRSLIYCDVVLWSLLGVSLAGWNVIVSTMLAIYAFVSSIFIFRIRKNREIL